jgi:plastocyanin
VKQRIRPYAAVLAVCAAVVGVGCGSDNNDNSASTSDTGTTATTQTETSATTPAAAATVLKIDADPSGALKFDKTSLTAKPGKVTIEMDNPSSVPHAVEIEGASEGSGVPGKTVEKGGVSKATATLKAGTYTFYCPVDGHEAAGMKGTLTVK